MKQEIIYKTLDYDRFTRNDAQPEHRIHRPNLEKELLKSGGNLVPAQVDSKHTIIEGHGRHAICKKNGLPFRYMVIEEGVDTITTLNTTSAGWRLIDYIESHGNSDHSYKMLYGILTTRKVPYSSVKYFIGLDNESIKHKNKLNVDFTKLIEFIDLFKRIVELTGITEERSVARAVTKFLKIEVFEQDRLVDSIIKNWTRMNPIKIGGEEFILKRLSDVYDYRSRTKIDLETLAKAYASARRIESSKKGSKK